MLEIEDLESGRRLTGGERRPQDVFHSRLAVSPDGRHLLMAGWLWHPYGVGWVFDLQNALADSSALDGRGIAPLYEAVDAEVAAACWLDEDRVVMAASAEEPLDGGNSDVLSPGQIGVWSVSAGAWQHRTCVADPIGTMIARGDQILGLHGHPRLIDPRTGTVLDEWPDVAVSTKNQSYGVTHVPTPVAALHPDRQRLAVAQPDHIAVIHLRNGCAVSSAAIPAGGSRTPYSRCSAGCSGTASTPPRRCRPEVLTANRSSRLPSPIQRWIAQARADQANGRLALASGWATASPPTDQPP